MAASYQGRCHCGAIGFSFRTALPPGRWSVRACQCSFCRAHGARTTSDPDGAVRFEIARPDALVRYDFALRTAEFLLCRHCGVYIAAVMTTPSGAFATLNCNGLQSEPAGLPAPRRESHESESREERVARRARRWTPVRGGLPGDAPR